MTKMSENSLSNISEQTKTMKYKILTTAILLPSIILGTVSPSLSQVAFKQQPIAVIVKNRK